MKFPRTTLAALTVSQQELIAAAKAALVHAYQPYSQFRVAAALRATDGTIIAGTNLENASYGLTNCAERSAIAAANAQGYRTFTAVAVIAATGTADALIDVAEPVAPCGACRQVLFEFAQLGTGDMELLLSNTSGSDIIVTNIAALLPLPFGPRDMHVDIAQYGNR